MTENKKHYREIGDGLMAVICTQRQYGKGDPSIIIEISMQNKCHPLYGSLCVRLHDYHEHSFSTNMDAMLNLLHSEVSLPVLLESFMNNQVSEMMDLAGDSVWCFGQFFYETSMIEAKCGR